MSGKTPEEISEILATSAKKFKDPYGADSDLA